MPLQSCADAALRKTAELDQPVYEPHVNAGVGAAVGVGVGAGVGGAGEDVGGTGVGLAVHDVPVGQQLVCPLLGWNLPVGQALQMLLQMHLR